MFGIGTTELLIIALIIILLFGGRKIPEFFQRFGESIKEFRKSVKDEDKDK